MPADADSRAGRIARRGHLLLASRREIVFGGLCLCCLPASARAAESFALEEVGPGIFVRDSVLVTDTGGSLADGQWLRAEIAKRTDKPVRHVLLTHGHPDHCFGAAAFAADGPNFIGHRRLGALLDARGEYYRARLADILGADKAGSVVYPTQAVESGAEIDLGGRLLRLTAHGTAHTSSDLSMLDTQTGILFPADLLFVTRVPSLDGSLLGWLREAEKLAAAGAARAVPGHGPAIVDFAPAMADLTRYLSTPARRNPQGDRRWDGDRRGSRDRSQIRARRMGLVRRLQRAQRHASLQGTRMGVAMTSHGPKRTS